MLGKGRILIRVLQIFWVFGVPMAMATPDTILLEVQSRPYFYNIAEAPDGRLLCGTASGVYEVVGLEFKQINKQSGYLAVDEAKGTWSISPNSVPQTEISNWIHLLPASQKSDYGTHAERGQYFYLVTNGKIHMYQLTNYRKSYRGQSIRSISKNHLASYSGVYLNGKRIHQISFSSGYIREFDTVSFVCHDGLLMITRSDTVNYHSAVSKNFTFLNESFGFARDIVQLPNHKYLVFTTDGLYEVDFHHQEIEKIYNCTNCEGGAVYLGRMEETLFIGLGNDVYRYVIGKGLLKFHINTNFEIQAGLVSGFDLFVLHTHQLVRYDLQKKPLFIADFSHAHSLMRADDTLMFVSTNKGLFTVNPETNQKALMIPDIEFNKRALYIDEENVHVGSVIGLFSFKLDQVAAMLFNENNNARPLPLLPSKLLQLLLGLAVVVIIFLAILARIFWKKILGKQVVTKIQDFPLSELETFIEENLAHVSIPMICDQFNVSVNQLYQILSPEKPGALIHRARMAKVIELGKKGKSMEEIAQASGFSLSYLQKIKRKIPVFS
jgi:hypothetical protein